MRKLALTLVVLIIEGCGLIGSKPSTQQCQNAFCDMAQEEGGTLEKDILVDSRAQDILKDPVRQWLGALVPYEIDPALTEPERVQDAIAAVESKSLIRFLPRESQDDYIVFVPAEARDNCSSYLGRRGGRQVVYVGLDCSTGNVMHEIGHLVGLHHEQSRSDRDAYVQIHPEAILPGFLAQFRKAETPLPEEALPYDYGSIMHYGPLEFAAGQAPTITAVSGTTAEFGQRSGFSELDFKKIDSLYADSRSFLRPQQLMRFVDSRNGSNCGIGKNGAVYCWPSGTTATQIPLKHWERGVKAFAAGKEAACGAFADHFGCEAYPEFPDNEVALGAAQLANWPLIEKIAIGRHHACVLILGSVACWGDNAYGRVSGNKNDASEGVKTFGWGDPVIDIAVSDLATCASTARALYCWGHLNYTGVPADGTTAPVAISLLANATSLAMSGDNIVCAVAGGMLRCFGKEVNDLLGNGPLGDLAVPQVISALGDRVLMGEQRACLLGPSLTPLCWGMGNTWPTYLGIATNATDLSLANDQICVLEHQTVSCHPITDGVPSSTSIPMTFVTLPE